MGTRHHHPADLRNMDNFKHMHDHYMASRTEKATLPEDPKNIRECRGAVLVMMCLSQSAWYDAQY